MIATLLVCWSAISLSGAHGRCDQDCMATVYAMGSDEIFQTEYLYATQDGDTAVGYSTQLCREKVPQGFEVYEGQPAMSLNVRGIRQDDLENPPYDND